MNRLLAPALIALPLVLSACELGPKVSQQTGFRGTGMDQIVDPTTVRAAAAIPKQPYPLPPDEGPTAAATYQNVKVLGGLSSQRFDHLMAEITQWVAPPEQGCNYCHNPANLASDEKYTKVVARRMLQMTRTLNTRWASHVGQTGVTCWTCHRGNAVPEYKWALAERSPTMLTIRGNKRGQNTPDPNVGYASLPSDPFASYLQGGDNIRIAGNTGLRTGVPGASIKQTEATYGLMMHISGALGVNCTYCHNTQSMGAWPLSRAQRATAYYGIRMVRDVNDEYINSLASVFPANRKGPHGDPYKANCLTCHQGLSKPLGGVSMRSEAPGLFPVATPASLRGGAPSIPPAAASEGPEGTPAAPVTATR
jgi:photosynthetic reaction center cytochrome c subunit